MPNTKASQRTASGVLQMKHAPLQVERLAAFLSNKPAIEVTIQIMSVWRLTNAIVSMMMEGLYE